MDRAQLKKMMDEMAAVGQKYGFNVTPNGGTLGEVDAKIKFTVRAKGQNGEHVISNDTKVAAAAEGIDITKEFICYGKKHKIIDYKSRNYKSPWITSCSDGKIYKWPTAAVKFYMSQM